VDKARITSEEFDQIKQMPRSRWAKCIQKLLRSKDGAVETEHITEEEDTPYQRRKMQQAIYSLARHNNLSVSVIQRGRSFLIQRKCLIGQEATQ
jgi:hypothetical protein